MSPRLRVNGRIPRPGNAFSAWAVSALSCGLVVVCGLLGGCAGSAAEEDDHAAHQIPAHRPRDFASAAVQLRTRWNALPKLDGRERDERRRELGDILRWLPEIAGESELGPRDWNEVQGISETLTSIYDRQSRPNPAPAPGDVDVEKLFDALDRIVPQAGHTIYGRSNSASESADHTDEATSAPHS